MAAQEKTPGSPINLFETAEKVVGVEAVEETTRIIRRDFKMPDGSTSSEIDVYISEDLVRRIGDGDRMLGLVRLLSKTSPELKSPFEDLELPQNPDRVN